MLYTPLVKFSHKYFVHFDGIGDGIALLIEFPVIF